MPIFTALNPLEKKIEKKNARIIIFFYKLMIWWMIIDKWKIMSKWVQIKTSKSLCKGRFSFLNPKDEWTQAQRAQYNEFVESGLKS